MAFWRPGLCRNRKPVPPINFNELWKYNPTTNQWTWVSGDNGSGDYGTQGIASPANLPPPRYYSVSWTDGSGNLWLHGGNSYFPISAEQRNYNDLWKYDPLVNQWTWMKGDNTYVTPDAPGVYGTQGIADAANKPGSRYQSVTWTDTFGNLWLFGGDQSYMMFDGTVGGVYTMTYGNTTH